MMGVGGEKWRQRETQMEIEGLIAGLRHSLLHSRLRNSRLRHPIDAVVRHLSLLNPILSTTTTTQQQQQQQQQTSLFQPPQSYGAFGFSTPLGAAAQPSQPTPFGQTPSLPFGNAQLTTQMAPVAPLPFSLADRDIQAIVDAYREDPGNPKYGFKHLLFSVTEPQFKIKPSGVSDIMWAEAMGKLEGMESSNRERLWPQLVQGFKDLSQRLKVMRIVEALEGKGSRLPLMKGEVEVAEKLAVITRQLKGSGAELSRRVQNLLTIARVQANGFGGGGSLYLPGSTKIHERSLADMQEVLQQQTRSHCQTRQCVEAGC
ncbi:hypothetical protein Acr_06g0000790 [Actinidia rufa]|uniref:Nucleoporin Nup54 alpha-helical domain-containing protein n=1 Tax=Actinidia rufa TaxID=165716 RepID=A0A7J0EQ47_9ERIC|nr:hypothetical protein Acr_06g0000790 [Actinidia rufa]